MTSNKTQTVCSKPTLNAEEFQSLLAAAYILQSSSSRTPQWRVSAAAANAFTAGAILVKPTPSIQPSLSRSRPFREANAVPNPTGRMFWKKVEASAIAAVFCLMMSMSIHHRLTSLGRAFTAAETLETGDAASLESSAPRVMPSSQQAAAALKAGQRHDDDEADVSADELVIHYRAPAVVTTLSQPFAAKSTTSEPGARIPIGQQAKLVAANKVVQYGDDVTMWLPEESSSGQASPRALRKSFRDR